MKPKLGGVINELVEPRTLFLFSMLKVIKRFKKIDHFLLFHIQLDFIFTFTNNSLKRRIIFYIISK